MKNIKYIILVGAVLLTLIFSITANAQSLEGIELPSIPQITKPISQMTIPELQAKIAEIIVVVQQLQALLAKLKGITGIPGGYGFNTNLKYGTSSLDVKYLQIILNQDSETRVSGTGWGSSGSESMYFGQKTLTAVIKFQEKYSIPNTGYVGPITRTKLNELLSDYRAGVVSTPTPTPTPTPPIATIALSVELKVATDSQNWQDSLTGTAPLTSVDLRAKVSGTATGTINYMFDCESDGKWDSPEDMYYKGILPVTKVFTNGCSYQNPGTYTAKVKVERGTALPAEDTVIITVSSPPAPAPTGGGGGGGAPAPAPTPEPTPAPTPTPTPTPTPPPTPTLSVSLSANPSTGQALLSNISLTATVSGTATGNINYTFYCNRQDTGTNITTPSDAKYDSILETTKTASNLCSYSTAGTYTAKVIIERATLQEEARTTITVSSAPAPPSPVCGDGSCNGTETCSTCPQDCGTCPVNNPPVLNAIGNKSTNENQQLSFTISATDPDNDPLTYSVTNLPSGAAFNASTRTFSWTPSYTQSGTYNVTFTVSDSKLTDTEAITITVINVNRAPVLSAIGNKSVAQNNTLTFTISATDTDGDTLTYSATNLPSGATFNASTRTFSWTPATTGTYSNITFNVSDGSLTDSETITITVSAAASVCGDGSCNGTETCSSCPGDCGTCPTGNVYYLDAVNGNDSNPGTSEQPWKTLNRAYTWYSGAGTKVAEGDTVLFRNGSYGTFREHTNDGEGYLFYRNDWVTYKAAPGHHPILAGIEIQNLDKWPPLENGRSYLIFDGFTLSGAGFLYTSYIKVLNSTIQGTPVAGISGYYEPYFVNGGTGLSAEYSNYVTFQGNNVSQSFRGIKAGGGNFLIKNNTIHHISEDGIEISGASPNGTVEGNLVYDHRRFTTVQELGGTKNGTFSAGEVVYISDIPTVTGIYAGPASTGNLYVYPTSQTTFLSYKTAGKTVIGEQSGATLALNYVDPPHTDSLQLDAGLTENLIIRNNEFNRVLGGGLGTESGQAVKLNAYTSVNVTLENNLMVGSSYGLGFKNAKINNNTIIGEFKVRTLYHTSSTFSEISNNIFEEISLEQDFPGETTITVDTHKNNIYKLFGSAYPSIVLDGTEQVITSDANLAALFVNKDANDYNLAPTSLAINFGNPNYGPATDILGNPRVGNPDAGAYEYQGAAPQCSGTDTSCGTYPSCQNCNNSDGCSGTTYRDYSCSGTSCIYTEYPNDSRCYVCTPGQTQSCNTGLLGICSSGTQTCQANGTWGTCVQNNPPATEVCTDSLDNDCDGTTDCSDTDCSADPACATTIPSDYISYWKFEGNANDEKGTNNGTIYGNPQYVSGKQGQGLSFDGDGDGVYLGDSPLLI